ncbi:MAG: hypothetical protein Edafosvirus16_12 [Edafosvirus sp.]|uniref:Protein kinase domain-containing protein n=1 Tax=Edafosvirus sp. TaxID=2487765 RepID=A0A3G4ZY65_9VIRU|nr:MAG: hypothetical protein Edafosvirus16_12 [Edafosvirus sp.]
MSLFHIFDLEIIKNLFPNKSCNDFNLLKTTKMNIYRSVFFKNQKDEYFVMTNEIIGRGGSGTVFQAYQLFGDYSFREIVIKHVTVFPEEIIALKKIGMYIAHDLDYILMERARGISYDYILKSNKYSCDQLIKIHKKIIEKYTWLNNICKIDHGDARADHIFVSIDEKGDINIDLIDFGMSMPTRNQNDDVHNLNNNILCYFLTSHNEKFKQYILKKTNYPFDIKHKSPKNLLKRLISSL